MYFICKIFNETVIYKTFIRIIKEFFYFTHMYVISILLLEKEALFSPLSL